MHVRGMDASATTNTATVCVRSGGPAHGCRVGFCDGMGREIARTRNPRLKEFYMDVTEAVTTITAIGVAVGSIGAAKLVPAAISVGWKWAKGAIFG